MSTEANQMWITLSGLPLRIALEWPYKKSVSGADFYVLHATLTLEGSGGLHATAAVQLTLTVAEVLASLEARDSEAPTINTLRKAVDAKDVEFTKNPKRVPVPFNTRRWNLKRQRWDFGVADEASVSRFLLRNVYWQSKAGTDRVHVVNPVDAQYLDTAPEGLLAAAKKLADQGLIGVEGEWAMAKPALLARGEEFERDRQAAQEALEKKHAFERG